MSERARRRGRGTLGTRPGRRPEGAVEEEVDVRGRGVLKRLSEGAAVGLLLWGALACKREGEARALEPEPRQIGALLAPPDSSELLEAWSASWTAQAGEWVFASCMWSRGGE